MSDIVFRQVRQLVARKMGVREDKITMDTRLGRDLGMDGADAWEFLDDFCEEFGVDMTDFPLGSYFGPEAGFIFSIMCIICYLIGVS